MMKTQAGAKVENSKGSKEGDKDESSDDSVWGTLKPMIENVSFSSGGFKGFMHGIRVRVRVRSGRSRRSSRARNKG